MKRKIEERTKAELIDRLPEYLNATGRSTTKKFRCINPAHKDNTPSMSYDEKHKKVHCFGCGVNYDIFDVIGLDNNIAPGDKTSFPEKYNLACDYFNIKGTPYEERPEKKKPAPEEKDYTEYFLQAHKAINQTTYHRGLNAETLNRFNIGFDPVWKHPKRYSDTLSPRLIIPTGKSSYTARFAAEGDFIGYTGQKMNKAKVGNSQIFNVPALGSEDKPVFIVEGELDAMSIEQSGYPAVGTGSISNISLFLDTVKQNRPKQPLIIALDNESNENTRKAEEELMKGLEKLGVSSYRLNFYGKYKDANEFLQAEPESLRQALQSAADEIESICQGEAQQAREAYIKEVCTASYLDCFVNDIAASVNTPAIPTGFKALDSILDGGLYAGLYTLGAITSLGKTTFLLQMADQIAQQGDDVLIFSLEMARTELMSKSISRHTFLIAEDEGRSQEAKTARGITSGAKWKYYTASEKQLINNAVAEYKAYAEHIFIFEGMGDIGITQVRETVEKHITLTGNRPVVIVDYLQILAPYNERSSDKQNTDKAVLELKRMSRDLNLPVVTVSSFNRTNYTAPVNLTSFKESGAVEYGSDVLIGLQYKGMDYREGEAEVTREKRIRSLIREMEERGKAGADETIQLKILKNRQGGRGNVIFSFYPMFNLYEELPDEEEEEVF